MSMLKNLRTGTRVASGFALVLLVLVALTLVGIVRVNMINASLATINDVNSVKETYAIAFRGSVHDRAIAVRDAVLVPPAQVDGVANHIDALESDYKQAATPLDAMVSDRTKASDEERAILAKIEVDEARTMPLIADVLAKREAGDQAGAQQVVLDSAAPAFVDWLNDVNRFIDLEERLNQIQAQTARNVGRTFELLMIALTAAAIAIGSVIAWLITRYITKALGGEPNDVRRLADAIRDGSLVHEVHVRPGDTDSILATMDRMRNALREVVEGVRTHADGVLSASLQISNGNADLSTRTESQSASIEETSASMQQLTDTVRQNTSSAKQASGLATTAENVAARGSDSMTDVVETMDGISAASARIGDIISVIEGIAFQTNILALNAAVEAARAGTQGRGFAVVATEVRSLAQRAATAAKEIKELIENSVRRVHEGSEKVREAGATMDEILRAVRQVNQIMGEIAEASDVQNDGIEQVGRAIAHIDDATLQNATLVEQAAAAAHTLKEQAHALYGAVAVFRVGDAANGVIREAA
ncbi:MAG: methyl-accepting chemotaxis protein [Paraburkholderia sp.]|uniref:methyl-accepting chemotaxis protein n=1 Tax=Paraburkholderia sp. TaxID=1926495 RepID=UPI002B002BD6|nr:methyl-accepting chemotaxis protein [Paraburkholderia sp.]MEA3084094.1 methyl-accepting chemotaxis protein [Paraburkholderia sp.]